MSMFSDSLRAFLRPIVLFLDDPQVTEILVHGHDEIWVERGGRIERAQGVAFSPEGLQALTRNIAQFVGRVLNDERPRLDARLPDGSRIHVMLPPVARRGIIVAIRKFAQDSLTMDELVRLGTLSPALVRLLEAAVRLKLNVIVSGGSGGGKTTLLNIMSRAIPADERIVTVEDSAELQLQQPHVIGLESRPADKFGKGEVSLGDLLHSSLRLRPDRLIVGEVRGGEAFHLLQALNTGHAGSLATTHANTPVDTLRRLETLCLMSGLDVPLVAVRAQVASAVDLVITCDRVADGSRKVTHVAEVLPLNDRGEYRTRELFSFVQTAREPRTGRVLGYHAPTGLLPSFLPKLRAGGFEDLDEHFFDPATYGLPPAPAEWDDDPHARWAPSLLHRAEGLPDPEWPEPELPELAAEPEPEPLAAPLFEETPAPAQPTAPAPEPETPAPRLRTPPKEEPSIEIAADLLEEVAMMVVHEATSVRRNPLLEEKTDPQILLPKK